MLEAMQDTHVMDKEWDTTFVAPAPKSKYRTCDIKFTSNLGAISKCHGPYLNFKAPVSTKWTNLDMLFIFEPELLAVQVNSSINYMPQHLLYIPYSHSNMHTSSL